MSRTTSIRQSALRLAAVVAVAGLVAGAESASAGSKKFVCKNHTHKGTYSGAGRSYYSSDGTVKYYDGYGEAPELALESWKAKVTAHDGAAYAKFSPGASCWDKDPSLHLVSCVVVGKPCFVADTIFKKEKELGVKKATKGVFKF